MAEIIKRSALLENEEMDWSINYTLKLICAIIFGAVSLGFWLGYSTPNTINVGVQWMEGVRLNLVLFLIPGSFVGWIFGLGFSFLEYGSMLGYLWKKRWYFMVSLIVSMGISIYASYNFNQFSEQTSKIKEDTISSHENLVVHFQKMIDAQDDIIEGRKHYINTALPSLRTKYMKSHGYEPDFISMRERQALEAIDSAMDKKEAYSDSLNKYTFRTIDVKNKTGYIVRLSNTSQGSKKSSLIAAILIEILLVFCGFVAIAFFSSIVQDTNRGIRKSAKYVIDKYGKLKRKTQGKENRKENVKDSSKRNPITKLFAGKEGGKDNGNGKVKLQRNEDSLRKPIVEEWFAQLNDIQQGKRKKTNQQEIADKLKCERQNVYWHLKQEGLI